MEISYKGINPLTHKEVSRLTRYCLSYIYKQEKSDNPPVGYKAIKKLAFECLEKHQDNRHIMSSLAVEYMEKMTKSQASMVLSNIKVEGGMKYVAYSLGINEWIYRNTKSKSLLSRFFTYTVLLALKDSDSEEEFREIMEK